MKLFRLCFSAVFMICFFCHLLQAKGHEVCQQTLIERINVSAELRSKILLPCLFDFDSFRLEPNGDSSAVWSQINTTIDYIVEIYTNGMSSFWNARKGRITSHFTSGNYSILIENVQSSDLGLYRCELFRLSNCSLAYKEISLSLQGNNWQRIVVAAGGGGGFLLLCLIGLCVYYTTAKRQTSDASVELTSDNCQERIFISGQTVDEVTYTSIVHKSHRQHESQALANKTPANFFESEEVSSETVIYSAVKKRDN